MSEPAGDRLKGRIKGDTGRAERLAAELRRNLRKRKDRTRPAAGTQAPEAAADAPLAEESRRRSAD